MKGVEKVVLEKRKIDIKAKWLQGNTLVLNLQLNYETSTKTVQASCPLEMAKNTEQFRQFLLEVWETHKDRTADLSFIPEGID